MLTLLPSVFSMTYFTRGWFAFRIRVSPSFPKSFIPIPGMEYIFIISCILLLSSDRVIMEDIFLFFSFSIFMVILSFFRTFFITLPTASAASSSSFAVFLLVFALKVSVKSASILWNLMPSFLASSWEMKGWSILWVRMTASILAALNMLIYWLCCFSSVT